MLCLYLTIALYITGMLPVSLGDSFNPGLISDHLSARLHKRDVHEDLPVPRAIAEDFTSIINNLAEAAHTQGAEGKAHRHEISKIPGEPHKRFFHWIFAFLSGLFSGKIFRSGTLSDVYSFNSGMVIIQDREGPYCTGSQLQPWIVLTTVECVRGEEAKNLKVWVRLTQSQIEKVDVSDVIINPDYVEGKEGNDQAILIIFESKMFVKNFSLPPMNFNPDTLSSLDTYVHDWITFNTSTQVYLSDRDRVKVTNNYTVCHQEVKSKNLTLSFCCERLRGPYTYYSYEIGSPFYYLDSKDGKEYVVGLYAGYKFDDKMPGHVFLSILPDLEWINHVIHEHPKPPKQ